MSRTELSTARDLIAGLQKNDPRLYNALLLIADSVEGLLDELEPLLRRSEASVVVPEVPVSPAIFTYTINSTTLVLEWSTCPFATFYELRKFNLVGDIDWDTADFVEKTSSLIGVLAPIAVGTHYYLVKSENVLGQQSKGYSLCVVVIPALGTPTLTSQVIDNNVLLYWTVPSSAFQISHYNLYRNSQFFGECRSTFATIFETTAGNYTYEVEVEDIAGNKGAKATVTCFVNTPPDFVLMATQVDDLSGTLVNGLKRNSRLLVPVAIKSWEDHFTDETWLSPDDQWDAGFHLYIEPTPDTASYTRVFDFGGVFNNTIVNIEWTYNTLGTFPVGVSCTQEASDDGLSWEAPLSGKSAFHPHLRYMRMTLNFAGNAGLALGEFWNITIALNVKQEMDSGEVNCYDHDAGGTVVTFNKAFKDVNSITLSSYSLQPLECLYDFNDVPNPTQFKVLVFDSSGNRVDANVSWKARGIV